MLTLSDGVALEFISYPSIKLSDVADAVFVDYIERHNLRVVEWNTVKGNERNNETGHGPVTREMLNAFVGEDGKSLVLYGEKGDEEGFLSVRLSATYCDIKGPLFLKDCITVSSSTWDMSNDATPERSQRAFANHETLARTLVKRFPALVAQFRRYTNYYAPTPPFADPHIMLQIVSKDDIAKSYDNPELYWSVWESVEDYDDGRVLVSRGLSILDDLEYKKSVYARTWDLARNAKPGLTEYSAPDLREHDLPYMNAGKPWLAATGYNPQEQWVEYAGAPGPDDHVLPHEILHFYVWLGSEKWQDGRPLKGIRVVFPMRDIAEREKRPLLDVGCRVFYMDSSTGLDTEISA